MNTLLLFAHAAVSAAASAARNAHSPSGRGEPISSIEALVVVLITLFIFVIAIAWVHDEIND